MPLTDAQLDRYARHIVLREIGGPGQQKLLAARVLLIGAGGLGSPCALYLAAAGVGTIGIADHDTVSLSNLQRQILHRTEEVGNLKTESAARALAAVNPDVRVIPHTEKVTAENARRLIAGYDLVADGSDNFETRYAVNAAAVAEGKTLVSAAVGRFDGQLAVFAPHTLDAAGARNPCYRCLVPEAPPRGAIATCAEAGIVGALTGVMGAMQALEVVKEIAGAGETLRGRLLLYDGLAAEMRTVRLTRDPDCATCGGLDEV